MDKIAYIIGNGTIDSNQIEYIKENRENNIIISMNSGIANSDKWGFNPDISGHLEMIREHEYSDEKHIELLWLNEALKDKYKDVIFYYHFWVKKWMEKRNINIPSNFNFMHIYHWNYKTPDKKYENGVIKFFSSGTAFSCLAIQHLKCNNIVLIGCDGYRNKEECSERGFNYIKKNRRSALEWLKLRYWADLAFDNINIFNASLVTHIRCLPHIKLGDEYDIINGKKSMPKYDKSYNKTNWGLNGD